MVGRELTKVHQEFLHGTAAELSKRLEPGVKGELTVVLGPLPKVGLVELPVNDSDVAREFGRITDSGAVSRRAAVTSTAKHFGISARQVYAAIERTKIR